ncbi:MAG: UPF0701 protein YloC [uncultured Gemmatimonadaceae bacterium]|uniref:UPF0701 protein YloC n=1 Tax=uncultured Gemmatimonadaceae bacterium TaxID=246130 RepID=A0A6J4L100_9BACT|nr:MAG: UPF0701 protein YloC [uncultured Gemmatimonadaceae bacterium]
MTGFGAAEGTVGSARVSVELRTVNHRFFNPSIKLPSALSRWEGDVREALRQRVARGHVTLAARIAREAAVASAIDEARFAEHVAQLRRLQQRYGLDADIDVGTVLRMPEVFVSAAAGEQPAESDGTAEELLRIVDAAAAALTAMRDEEGARLAEFLRARLAVTEGAMGRVAARAPERLVAQRDRLRASVRELLDGVALDEARVAQEIAILADRLDVSEEVERFGSHAAAFRDALAATSGEPVGKRLGFLLQEMVREANTTGSKANDAAILAEVVTIKEELERMREQVENVE